MFCPMKLDCKTMTGVIYNCPNLSECLQNSTLDRLEALRLYFLNQGIAPEDIKISGQSSPIRPYFHTRFAYNTDYQTRDIIIFGNPVEWDEDLNDIKPFYQLSLAQLQQLIEQGFANPAAQQNNSPTIQAFLEFAQAQASKGFQFAFEGYAISPFRDDYRVSVEGIIYRGNYPYQMLVEFYEFVGEPDEIDVQSHYLRAWWD